MKCLLPFRHTVAKYMRHYTTTGRSAKTTIYLIRVRSMQWPHEGSRAAELCVAHFSWLKLFSFQRQRSAIT